MPKNLPLTGNRTECPSCRECFNSESAFDRHRVGSYEDSNRPRRYLTVDLMLARGFQTNAKGYWIRGQRPDGTLRRKTAKALGPCTSLPPEPRDARHPQRVPAEGSAQTAQPSAASPILTMP